MRFPRSLAVRRQHRVEARLQQRAGLLLGNPCQVGPGLRQAGGGGAAIGACGQVGVQQLVGRGIALAGQALQEPLGRFFTLHATRSLVSWRNCSRRSFMARCTRTFTVPSAQPRARAISL